MGAETQRASEPPVSPQSSDAAAVPFEAFELVLQPGTVLNERFVIRELLGIGGMGEVYKAEDLNLNRAFVAVKTIRAKYADNEKVRQRFQHEVLLARSIAHPNVGQVFEFFSCTARGGEIWFFTMKLLRGETLAARLNRTRVPVAAARRIAQEIAAGLQAIHEVGIVHRDLKPGNVFLEQLESRERAVVTDFGLAQVSTQAVPITGSGLVVGTPSYIAPELRAGEAATARSDIYSFGIILYELLLGEHPDAALTVALGVDKDHSWTRRLRPVISRCIAPKPSQRFASASEVASAVEAAFNPPRLLTRRRVLESIAPVALITAGLLSERDRIARLLHPLPRPRRVAIMPATSSSDDASLLDGVLDGVSNLLSRSERLEPDLFIVPPDSLRQHNVNTESEALKLFGTNLVLIGSLHRIADQLQMGLHLLETTTGKTLRQAEIGTSLATIYALPELTAQRAAKLLDISPRHWSSPSKAGDTSNAEAYASFQRARALLRSYGAPSVDAAISNLQKAVDLDPQFARAWAFLSDAYSAKFHLTNDSALLDLAARTSAKAVGLAPALSDSYSSRARVNLYGGHYDAAINDARRATQLDPDNPESQIWLAETYLRSGKLELVDQTYKQLSNSRPNDWLVLTYWGDFCIDQANYSKAERLLREATILAPAAALPWRNLGAVYLATYQLDKADEALNRSISLLPTGQAYTNLGTALFWQGKYRDASTAYLQAANKNPEDPLLWRNLGDAYQMINAYDKAKGAWRKAADLTAGLLELNPNNADAVVSLALYRAKLGENAPALSLLKKADTLNGRTVEQLFYEAQAYELAGRRDSALGLIKSCVRLGYSSADILHAPELADLRKDPRFVGLGLNASTR